VFHRQKIYNLLFEKEVKDTDASEDPVTTKGELKSRKSSYSIDNQIDSLIMRYEKDSIRSDEKDEIEESMVKKNLKYLLEQEEEPPSEAEEEAEEPTEPEAPTGGEEIKKTKPADSIPVPDLDLDAFIKRCVRLLSNHDKLLSMEEVIVNRIKNYLDEYYGDQHVVRLIDTLRDEYGIEVMEFDEDEMEETSQDEFAVGAFAGGTGGGGGG
jgi:hypothetical protein